ncbi:hypothetical protein MRX96_030579 [Rhipicephalus microplus]
MFVSRFASAVKVGFREFMLSLSGDRISTDSMIRVEQGSAVSLKTPRLQDGDYPRGDQGQHASSKAAQARIRLSKPARPSAHHKRALSHVPRRSRSRSGSSQHRRSRGTRRRALSEPTGRRAKRDRRPKVTRRSSRRASEALFKRRVVQLEQLGERLTIAPPLLDLAVRGEIASAAEVKRTHNFNVIDVLLGRVL